MRSRTPKPKAPCEPWCLMKDKAPDHNGECQKYRGMTLIGCMCDGGGSIMHAPGPKCTGGS